MLTTKPHLQARRPSPTTVEYIVSTCPERTLSFHLLLASTFLLRIAIGCTVLILLYSKWMLSPYSSPTANQTTYSSAFTAEFVWYNIHRVIGSSVGLLAVRLADRTPLFILLPICGVVLYIIFLRIHTEESLLVLRGLGVQISTSSNTYLSTASTQFIPTEKIQDIFVNEAFRGFEVRYYLVVVVEGKEEVVVVFPRLLPRRKIVETVWRGAKACLYAQEGGERKEDTKG
ncbi:GPI-GlcNAc transferase complex [Xylogone sp. PMI_703]|nr:GPI-GlcNAc transferase complex [Xylogone sp. PMI_703]